MALLGTKSNRKGDKFMCAYKTIFDADMEEPDCCRCDYCCRGSDICETCGPEYGWCGYKRTEIVEEDEKGDY